MTIREQGRLVGVTTLPDMAIGDKHTLTAGQDFDVRSVSCLFVYIHGYYRLGFIESPSKINLERETLCCLCRSSNFQKRQVNTCEIRVQ